MGRGDAEARKRWLRALQLINEQRKSEMVDISDLVSIHSESDAEESEEEEVAPCEPVSEDLDVFEPEEIVEEEVVVSQLPMALWKMILIVALAFFWQYGRSNA